MIQKNRQQCSCEKVIEGAKTTMLILGVVIGSLACVAEYAIGAVINAIDGSTWKTSGNRWTGGQDGF